jgi:hypothetical protein
MQEIIKKSVLFTLVLAISVNTALVGTCSAKPSESELREVAQRIMAKCQTRVLGHLQKEGEKIGSQKAAEITQCMDELRPTYLEGIKAGNR